MLLRSARQKAADVVRVTLCVLLVAAAPLSAAAEVADTLIRPAVQVAKPARAVLLGIARAGKRLVTVGERGLIAVSDDEGQTWRQVPVPVSVTLTAVTFPTPTQGWAVGHRGVILSSLDGGNTWSLRLDGRRFADAALAEAHDFANASSDAAEVKRVMSDAKALVSEGADKPFLDVSFADAEHGLAVGAYGLCARTDDGGKAWRSCIRELDNPKGAHLYAIARSGVVAYIAGEQGVLLRSDDALSPVAKYRGVPLAYNGSLFSLGVAANGDIVVGGLRGNAMVSTDHGRTFDALRSEGQGSISAATRLSDGNLLMVNQLGQVLRYDAEARQLILLSAPPTAPLNDVLQAADGRLVVVGIRGVTTIAATGV